MDNDGFEPPSIVMTTMTGSFPRSTFSLCRFYRCGAGQMLHAIEDEQGWNATAVYGDASLSTGTGCIGQALQIEFAFDDSTGPDQIEISKSFPAVDIGGMSFYLSHSG